MSVNTERWLKIFGLGLIVWLIPLLVENGLFFLQLYDERVFYAVLELVGVTVALLCLAAYLPGVRSQIIAEGWILGSVWLVLCLALNVAYFTLTGIGNTNWSSYLMQDGWLYLYIPVSAVSCAYLCHAVDARSMPVVTSSSILPIR